MARSIFSDEYWYTTIFGTFMSRADEKCMQDQVYAITMGWTDR